MNLEQKRGSLSLAVTFSALGLAAIHIIWPGLKVDAITIALVVIALLPWLGLIFESISFPGGGGVKYRDLERVEREATAVGLLEPPSAPEPLYAEIAQDDPNLALAGLRIEIEKRLRAIAKARHVDVERKSIRQLMNELTRVGALTESEVSVLRDLNGLLNQAVHGARVESGAVDWAMSVGPRLLSSLEKKG
jgi:hypothetical protein